MSDSSPSGCPDFVVIELRLALLMASKLWWGVDVVWCGFELRLAVLMASEVWWGRCGLVRLMPAWTGGDSYGSEEGGTGCARRGAGEAC